MAIDFPASPSDGQVYLDSSSNREFIYSATAQRWTNYGGFSKASLAKPLDPQNGEIFYNTTTDKIEVYNTSTTTWEPVVADSSMVVDPSDIYWNKVPLLLRADDGFTNHSDYGKALDSNGNIYIASTQTLTGRSNSYVFSGSGVLSTLGANKMDLLSEFTFEAWLHPTSYPSIFAGIFFLGDNTQNDWRVQLAMKPDGTIQYYSEAVSASTTLTSTTSIPLNTWTHVAFTKCYQGSFLFINGEVQAHENASTETWAVRPDNNNQVYIGYSRSASTGRYWVGYMDQIRVTNHPRYFGSFELPAYPLPIKSPGITTPTNDPATPTQEGIVYGLTSDPANNTFLGHNAGVLAGTTTKNTIIGDGAAFDLTSGNANTLIGRYNAPGALSNHVVLSDGDGIIRTAYNQNGAISVGNSLTNYGTSGQILTSQGGSSSPTWETLSTDAYTEAYATHSGVISGYVGISGIPSSAKEIWFEYSGISSTNNNTYPIVRMEAAGTIQTGSIYHYQSGGHYDGGLNGTFIGTSSAGSSLPIPMWNLSSSYATWGRFQFMKSPTTNLWTVQGHAAYQNYYFNIIQIIGQVSLPNYASGVYISMLDGSSLNAQSHHLNGQSAYTKIWYR